MSDIKFSLIDLGGLSKPACKLIETVAKAIGVAYEPERIRQRARAEGEALITHAQAQSVVSRIEDRTRQRLWDHETRRQANIEAIVQEASNELPEDVNEQSVDEDWIYAFFGNCADVGDKQMQALWARILAGEVAEPGKFSRRLLELIKCINKDDAEFIDQFFQHSWSMSFGDEGGAVGYLTDDLIGLNAKPQRIEPYVPYGVRLHVESLGLCHRKVSYKAKPGWILFNYQGERYVTNNESPFEVDIHMDCLTTIGTELFSICKPQPDIAYRDACIKQYRMVAVSELDINDVESAPDSSVDHAPRA